MYMKKCLLLIGIATLTACATPALVTEAKKEITPYVYVPEVAVSVSCVQHEGVSYIHEFYVGELTRRRMAGGGNCGGLIAAGYLLPEKWTPGMRVKVRWKPNGRDYVEKTTNIMQYDEPGTIYVHFFKDDQVRVVAANSGPNSLSHPIPWSLVVPPFEGQ